MEAPRVARISALAIALTAIRLASPAAAAVDLTGDYRLDETAFPMADACTAVVVQTGTSLALSADCIGGNSMSASGTIDVTTGEFTLSGTCDLSGPPPGPGESLLVAGTGSQDSLTFDMGGTCGTFPVQFFGTKCGNGNLDANEECEDGNRDAGDCCSGACAAETGNVCDAPTPQCTLALCDSSGACVSNAANAAAGTPCDLDADLCTEDLCDGAATCESTGEAIVCDSVCETCLPQSGCSAVPSDTPPHPVNPGECVQAVRDKAVILNRLDEDDRDRLTWSWKKGAVPVADFGTPTVSTGYTLCIFGRGSTAAYSVLGELEIPPGSGWTAATEGFKYDQTLPGVGRVRIDLRGSTGNPRSKIKVRMKGAGLGYPALIDASLAGTMRVSQIELRADNGKCWASVMGVDKRSGVGNGAEKLKLRDCKASLSTCR